MVWEQNPSWLTSVNSDGSTNAAIGASSSLCSNGILCALGMFDNDDSTRWHCNQPGPCDFELDFGAVRSLKAIYITSISDRVTHVQVSAKQISSDSWNILQIFSMSDNLLEEEFASVHSVQYLRIEVDNSVNRWPAIGEFKLEFTSSIGIQNDHSYFNTIL